MPDQKGGPEGGLWYQGMSRVVPGCPQTSPRAAGEGRCIWDAYGGYRTSNIQHPTSNTQHPTPNIQHPTSKTHHKKPNIQHPTSNTQHPTSNTQHPTPNIQHPTPNIQSRIWRQSGNARGNRVG